MALLGVSTVKSWPKFSIDSSNEQTEKRSLIMFNIVLWDEDLEVNKLFLDRNCAMLRRGESSLTTEKK